MESSMDKVRPTSKANAKTHEKHLLSFPLIFQQGAKLYKQAVWVLFPFAFLLAGIAYVIQPRSKPTFTDTSDWVALGMFIAGLFCIAVLHGSLVFRLFAIVEARVVDYRDAIYSGIANSFAVISVLLLALLAISLGLLLFVVPGIYMGVVLSLAPLFIVIYQQKSKGSFSFFRRIKKSFESSINITQESWWRTFGVLLTLAGIAISIELICQLFLQNQIVLASIVSVMLRAIYLPFIYCALMVLLLDLEKRDQVERRVKLIP